MYPPLRVIHRTTSKSQHVKGVAKLSDVIRNIVFLFDFIYKNVLMKTKVTMITSQVIIKIIKIICILIDYIKIML